MRSVSCLLALLVLPLMVMEAQANPIPHRAFFRNHANVNVNLGVPFAGGFHHTHGFHNGVNLGRRNFFRGSNTYVNVNAGLGAGYVPANNFALPPVNAFPQSFGGVQSYSQFSQQSFAAPVDPCPPPVALPAQFGYQPPAVGLGVGDPCPPVGNGFRRGFRGY